MPLESAHDEHGSGRPRPDVADITNKPDRDLQDEIIRYLTDTQSRSIYHASGFLKESEAERAQRFSRFLARRYYRDRLHRGFHYSSTLLAAPRSAGAIANAPEFESILDNCSLGSLTTSKTVGQLAIARLSLLRDDAWWRELLEYEFAFFLQLATSEIAEPGSFPIKNVSALLHRFHVHVPALLSFLKSGGVGAGDFRGETNLLFSRTHHGKVYVAEIDERTEAVFTAVNSNSSIPEIAETCALPVQETEQILTTLGEIGAVVLPAAATLENSV